MALGYVVRQEPAGHETRQKEPAATVSASFTLCNQFSRGDCVIDGDTFYLRGQRVRIADIDAPQTQPARCEYEQELAEQATRRLLDWLNAGPFSLEPWEERDEDAYGRKLRAVVRDGNSLGSVLVSEGLAREWSGRPLPWCD